MSYQRFPPGSIDKSGSGKSTPQTHGLPARPPPPAGNSSAQSSSFAFKPRNVASTTTSRNTASPAPAASSQPYGYPYGAYDMNGGADHAAGAQQSYYAPQSEGYPGGYGQQGQQAATSAPQISNPFAPPTQNAGYNGSLYGNAYDPEYQAQIQQWQSQYNAVPDSKNAASQNKAGNANQTPLAHNRLEGTSSATDLKSAATVEAQKTVIRKGGGQSWEDNTLLEWGNHHRLFIGNLAGEVTDESLLKAFSKYPSVQKARVVRDKRTTKSKGFGFVSLADADEYFQAAKEMQGKYIGSHPVLVRKAETEIKATNKKDDRNKGKWKGKGDGGKKDVLSAQAAGVKKQGKVEGKYKVLG